MKIITLLLIYNSKLEQYMTLYECLRWCTGICNESRATCMKELWMVALPQIQCQLHDHAKEYDNDGVCHDKWNGGKLHGNVSRNGYGNAMIGRYGGYFEEDIRRFMCDRAYHITGFGCTGEVCTNSQGEKGQCAVPKRLENCGKVSVRIIHGLTLVIKNSYTYCISFISPRSKVLLRMPLGG